MTILDVLAAEARERVAEARARVPLDDLRRRALDTPASDGFPFERALARPGLSFICEVKRASPSKGLIAPYFPYAAIARDYEAAGAAAISVLTEPRHFLGRDAYLAEIARVATVPLLRKDFTVDAYQVVEARALGASAVLLICAILSDTQLGEFLGLAESLGLSALTEAHTAAEVERAVRAGARVIGVNNRNLHDFTVDTGTSAALRALVPPGRLFVAESGVTSPDDVATAVRQGADAVLVGEALMRADDRQAALSELRAASWVTPAVKICGITRAGEVAVLNEVRPEYAGFVFAPSSRRYVEPATAASLRSLLDPRITTVGVFMDAEPEEVRAVVDSGVVTVVQLHGAEDAAYITALHRALPRTPVIKAARPAGLAEAARLGADALLVDGPRPGSGEPFDWTQLNPTRLPLILAGGLTPETAGAAARLGVTALDVSSGVETAGVKDPAKIRAFVAAARQPSGKET